jgi:hypothetical protein
MPSSKGKPEADGTVGAALNVSVVPRDPDLLFRSTRDAAANLEGRSVVRQRRLRINSLRMRPDRFIVGELHGEEALDVPQAIERGPRRIADSCACQDAAGRRLPAGDDGSAGPTPTWADEARGRLTEKLL